MASVSDLFRRMPGGHFEAFEWGRRYADDLGHAWVECPRADWLLWLIAVLEAPRRLTLRAVCDCVDFGLSLLPEADVEAELRRQLEPLERWMAHEASAEACWEAGKETLAIYQGELSDAVLLSGPATAGYAAAAVSAALSLPIYETAYGLACAASAAALTAAQIASPQDERAIRDAQRKCAEAVRCRISFVDVVSTPGFQLYARSLSLPGVR